jgi:hypothetical protein
MARSHYWQFLLNDEGNPIKNADIYIYEAASETPVYIYGSETGGVALNTTPHLVSNSLGYFEFWIADENESNGYPQSNKFKIAWSKPGIASGYIDFIDIFSPEAYIISSGFIGNLDISITTLQKLADAVDGFSYSINTSGFSSNLDSSVDDVQKLADAVDILPIFSIYTDRTALLAATGSQDGILCSVLSEPSNLYTWSESEDKWIIRSGNIYSTATLPTTGDFHILDYTFVINGDTGEQIYWEE